MIKLNVRQLRYKRFRIEGMTQKAAALKAGYSLATALSGPQDKTVDLKTALEVAGLTNRYLANKVFDGVNDSDGYLGHKYLETALKIRGDIGQAAVINNNVDKVNVVVMIPANPSFDNTSKNPVVASLPA